MKNETFEFTSVLAVALLFPLLVPPAARSQEHETSGHEMHAAQETAGHELAAETLAEIEAVKKVVEKFSTPEAAEAAGYVPRAGITPTMGRHYTNRELVADGEIDLLRPEGLMFAPVEGKTELVGVYYIKPQPKSAPQPEGFHGDDDRWHRHDPGERSSFFAEGGTGISMVHMWTIPAVDGPFTDHNHWLPFLTLGLPLPPAEFSRRHVDVVGKAALGLSETEGIFHVFAQIRDNADDATRAKIEERRAAIRAQIPPLRQAIEANDEERMLEVMTLVAGEFDALYEIYEAQLPERRAMIVDIAVGNMLGGHSHHGM